MDITITKHSMIGEPKFELNPLSEENLKDLPQDELEARNEDRKNQFDIFVAAFEGNPEQALTHYPDFASPGRLRKALEDFGDTISEEQRTQIEEILPQLEEEQDQETEAWKNEKRATGELG